MFDRILVPVDGSEPATAALEHALEIARATNAAVDVCYVADTNEPSLTRLGGEVVDALEREGREVVDEAADLAADRGVDSHEEIVQGEPAEVIREYAAERDVDLIAMGAHGRRGLGEYLLGSTTDRVVRESPVPVLTVRAAEDATHAYPYADVLVPVDGSEHARAALELGETVAADHGATLHLLTVVDEGTIGIEGASAAVADRLEDRARETAADAASRVAVDDVTTSVAFGSVPEEIRSAAASDADLVVMGTRGRTGLDRRLLGSVTERVLRTAPVPVLTTRVRDD